MSNREVRIHPTALVESDNVGDGTQIWAYAHVMAGAEVGVDCKLGDGAFVEGGARIGDRVTVKNNSLIWHGVTIGDDVFVGPNVVFTNDMSPRAHKPSDPSLWLDTVVERGASIGANSTIVCGVTLDEDCMVGAGSVVTKDVARNALVVGNPAKQIGWVGQCGQRLNEERSCVSCGRTYREEQEGLVEERS